MLMLSSYSLPFLPRHSWRVRRFANKAAQCSLRNYSQSFSPLRLGHKTIERDSGFAQLSEADMTYFRSVLQNAPSALIDSADELEAFNEDWMRKYRGKARLVLKPSTTQHVQQILAYCNERRLAVVPQGGNTGLVGGGVPLFDEIILSTQNLNQILEFNSGSGVLVCQAGCVLERLDQYLADKGFMMPLDLGAKGSCHIGGNLATNAGGLRLLRYGSLHGSVLGLEVVLADGTVLSHLTTLRKDNTGYDLKQLFIGSEGTLGVITAVSIQTPPRPQTVNVAVLACQSFENVLSVFRRTRQRMGEILSAFEFWDAKSLDLTQRHLHVREPFSERYPFYVLIETSGSHKDHDDAKMAALVEDVMEQGWVEDGCLAQDASQAQALWAIREGIPEACSKSGSVLKYDLSMPVESLYECVQDVSARLESKGLYNHPESVVKAVIGYGHMGDGNLHLNVSAQSYDPKLIETMEPFIYEWVQKRRGSISAEHGMGQMKAAYMRYSQTPAMMEWMRKVKQLFDPKGILNPYKFLPPVE